MNKRKEKVKFLEAKGAQAQATSSEEKQACKGALQRAEGVEDDVEWLAKSINKQEEIQSQRRSQRIDCNKKLDLPEGRDHAEVMTQLNEGVKDTEELPAKVIKKRNKVRPQSKNLNKHDLAVGHAEVVTPLNEGVEANDNVEQLAKPDKKPDAISSKSKEKWNEREGREDGNSLADHPEIMPATEENTREVQVPLGEVTDASAAPEDRTTSVDVNELDRRYLAEMKRVQHQRESAIRNLDVVMSQRREFLKCVYDEQMRLIDSSRRMEIKLKGQLDIAKKEIQFLKDQNSSKEAAKGVQSETKTIRVKNVSSTTTSIELFNLFSGIGEVECVLLIKERNEALIRFKSGEDAKMACVKINGFKIKEKILAIYLEW